jgi:hypothetical protein
MPRAERPGLRISSRSNARGAITVGESLKARIHIRVGSIDCCRPILLKNCSRLGQRGFAGGHQPSPERVAFNSGHSMRSNFSAVPAPLRQTSFSTLSVELRPSLIMQLAAKTSRSCSMARRSRIASLRESMWRSGRYSFAFPEAPTGPGPAHRPRSVALTLSRSGSPGYGAARRSCSSRGSCSGDRN